MPGSKHIVIKHEDLHPAIREEAKSLIEERKDRLKMTAAAAGLFTYVSMMTEMIQNLGIYPERVHDQNPVVTSVMLGGMPVISGAAIYKYGSMGVRKQTKEVGKAISAKGTIDEAGKYKIEKLKKTHPYAFVKRNGDVVLVPKTEFQKALKKAQETFLKEVIPGRYRIKL